VESIILNNSKLAIKILDIFNISFKEFIFTMLSKLVNEKRLNSIEESLQTFAEMKKKNIIPVHLRPTDVEV
jgi:hypothetical protein